MSDNFHFDLTGVSLERCFEIAFGGSRKAIGWRQEPLMSHKVGVVSAGQATWINKKILEMPNEERLRLVEVGLLDRKAVGKDGSYIRPEPTKFNRLILFWAKHESMTPLPGPLTGPQAVPFVQAWLNSTEYGGEPDHDGDNTRGCRVYNEDWGHIAGLWETFVAIEPVWMMHGK